MQKFDDMVVELYGCSASLCLIERMIGVDETQDRVPLNLVSDVLMGISTELERLADTADEWWLEVGKLQKKIAELEAQTVGK